MTAPTTIANFGLEQVRMGIRWETLRRAWLERYNRFEEAKEATRSLEKLVVRLQELERPQ